MSAQWVLRRRCYSMALIAATHRSWERCVCPPWPLLLLLLLLLLPHLTTQFACPLLPSSQCNLLRVRESFSLACSAISKTVALRCFLSLTGLFVRSFSPLLCCCSRLYRHRQIWSASSVSEDVFT